MLEWFAVLNPAGPVALSERGLLFSAIGFMLIVAVPVYFLLFFFAYKYRASNTKARYMPNWQHGRLEEFVWWVIPFEIILVLGALTWTSTHELDPHRPLAGGPPLVVEVVSLDWKWLFIYPEQGIASVNHAALPVGQPVEFRITADSPMNAFWIPRLGGMIYAMTGMATTLHLAASEPGQYAGAASNYSGEGFARMTFTAEAMPKERFDAWIAERKAGTTTLDFAAYKELAEQSTLEEPVYFAQIEPGLFQRIIAQFAYGSEPAHDPAHAH